MENNGEYMRDMWYLIAVGPENENEFFDEKLEADSTSPITSFVLHWQICIYRIKLQSNDITDVKRRYRC